MALAASRMSDASRAVVPGDYVLLIMDDYPTQDAILTGVLSPDRLDSLTGDPFGSVQVALVTHDGSAWVRTVPANRVGLRVDEV